VLLLPVDPDHSARTIAATLRAEAVRVLASRAFTQPAVENGALKALPFEPFPRTRIKQFARGVTDFGQGPSGV
jgi:hypothetical protein